METGFWQSKLGAVLRYLLFTPAFIVGYMIVNAVGYFVFKIVDNWFAATFITPALGMILGAEFASMIIPSNNKAAVAIVVGLFWLIMVYFTFTGASGDNIENRSWIIIVSSLVGGIAAIRFIVYNKKRY